MAYQFVAIGVKTSNIHEFGLVYKTYAMAQAEALAFIANYKRDKPEKIKVIVATVPPEPEEVSDWKVLPQDVIRGEM